VIKTSGTAEELKMKNQAKNLEEVFMKIAL